MKKLLFIRLSSLGDIVLTESCVRLCKEYFPEYEIHYLTKPAYTRMVAGFHGVSRVFAWTESLEVLKALKSEKYDYVIDLHNKFNTFLIKLFCGFKNITYDKQHLTRWLMTKKLSAERINSVVWNYLEVLNKIKKRSIDFDELSMNRAYYPQLKPDKETLNVVKEKFADYNIPANQYLIGIFPGATHNTKQCPIEKLINFMAEVPDYWKCSFLIMGDWKDKDIVCRIRLLSEIKIHDLTGAFDVSQLVAAVSLLDVVITNDSGPMHIAAALKKPQIAIYGATHTRLGFRPLNDKAVILQKNIFCQPCSLHGSKECRKGTLRCFREIPSEEVFHVFQNMFENVVTSRESAFY